MVTVSVIQTFESQTTKAEVTEEADQSEIIKIKNHAKRGTHPIIVPIYCFSSVLNKMQPNETQPKSK